MKILFVIMAALVLPVQAHAVTPAEDIATTIMLRGHPCGPAVTQIQEQSDARATEPFVRPAPTGFGNRCMSAVKAG